MHVDQTQQQLDEAMWLTQEIRERREREREWFRVNQLEHELVHRFMADWDIVENPCRTYSDGRIVERGRYVDALKLKERIEDELESVFHPSKALSQKVQNVHYGRRKAYRRVLKMLDELSGLASLD